MFLSATYVASYKRDIENNNYLAVGLCNYLKNIFSVYRINFHKNNFALRPFIDQDYKNIYLSLFENDEFLNRDLIQANNYYDWRLFVSDDDNIDIDYAVDHTTSKQIDFKYCHIPKNIQIEYIDIIKKFKILPNILQNVNEFIDKNITNDYLSVHIRTWTTSPQTRCVGDVRSSHPRYLQYKNTTEQKFIVEINKSPCDTVFIATDNFAEVQTILMGIHNKKIILYTPDNKLNSIQNDFVDLLILSKGKHFIGSYLSTYSELVWWYSDCAIPVMIL